MPCQNGGECANVLSGYICVCTKDYYGGLCESEYYSLTYIKTIFAQTTNYKSSDYVNGAKYNRRYVMSLDCILLKFCLVIII